MKKAVILILLQLIIFKGFAQWEKLESPKGIDINELINIDGTLYASTTNGTYFWQDNQWKWLTSTFTKVNTTTFLKDQNYLYSGTTGGIYRSDDNGASWIAINNNLTNLTVNDLKFHGNSVVAATAGGIFISSNNGIQWQNISKLPLSKIVNEILSLDNTLFAATNTGIYKSSDLGVTWVEKNTGIPAYTKITSLISVGTKLFASSIDNGVFMSANNAESWSKVNTNLTDLSVNKIYFKEDTLFAGTQQSLFYARDINNISWQAMPLNQPSEKITAISNLNGRLVVGNPFGTFISESNKFVEINEGFPNHQLTNIFSFSDSLFVQSSKGIWKVGNDRKSFEYQYHFPNNSVSKIIPYNETTYLLYNPFGVYAFNIDSKNWISLKVQKNISSLVVDEHKNIFIGTNTGVYRSQDSGVSWLPVNIGISFTAIKDLMVLDGSIFAISNKMYRSENNGDTWKELDAETNSHYIMVNRGSTIYRTRSNNSNYSTLSKSDDKGETWLDVISYGGRRDYVVNNPGNLTMLDHRMIIFENSKINISFTDDSKFFRFNKGYTDPNPTPNQIASNYIRKIIALNDTALIINDIGSIWKRALSNLEPPTAPSKATYYKSSDNVITINIDHTSNENISYKIRRSFAEWADIKTGPNVTNFQFDIDTLSDPNFYLPLYLYADNDGDWSELIEVEYKAKEIAVQQLASLNLGFEGEFYRKEVTVPAISGTEKLNHSITAYSSNTEVIQNPSVYYTSTLKEGGLVLDVLGVGESTITIPVIDEANEDNNYNMVLNITVIEGPLGLKPEIKSIKVFPNPTSSVVELNFPSMNYRIIKVMNNVGILLQEVSSNATHVRLDVGNYTKGMYFILIEENGKTSVAKLIKK